MSVSARRPQILCLLGSLLGLGPAACSDGGVKEDEPTMPSAWVPVSGSRLKARFLVGADGSRVFEGWFDEQRGEHCRLAAGESGRFYCFPYTNPSVFHDSRCREPLGDHRSETSCGFRYTGVARGDSRCGNATLAVYEEGPPAPPDPFYRASNDLCLGPEAVSADASFVTVTGRVPDTAFVSGFAESPRPDLRLGPRVIRFEDGAVAPFEMLDSRWNRRCTRVATDRGIRCIPEDAVFVGLSGPYFADQACSVPVAHADAPACLKPSVAMQATRENGCLRIKGVFTVGSRLDPRAVFSGGECRSQMLLGGHFYNLGEVMDLSLFPELTMQEKGSRRIRVRSYSASDGVAIPALGEQLWDGGLKVECRVAVASDGALRCLPLSGPSVVDGDATAPAFADAACHTPLARYNAARSCSEPPPVMAARGSLKHCPDAALTGRGATGDLEPGRWEIHRLGARHDGEVFFRSSGGCAAGVRDDGDEFYQLGAPLDPTGFVAFKSE
jgi:hypothetical protein